MLEGGAGLAMTALLPPPVGVTPQTLTGVPRRGEPVQAPPRGVGGGGGVRSCRRWGVADPRPAPPPGGRKRERVQTSAQGLDGSGGWLVGTALPAGR